MPGAPCFVCGRNAIPFGRRRGLGTVDVGRLDPLERVWSAIDDYAPVHVVCERRTRSTRGMHQWWYFGPKRRWADKHR